VAELEEMVVPDQKKRKRKRKEKNLMKWEGDN